MTVKFYCGAPDECTPAQAHSLCGELLDNLGIKIAFIHTECCLSPIREQTIEEIDELEHKHPSHNNFPLQPNCLYAYTPLEGTPEAVSHPIIKILTTHPKRTGPKQNIVYVNLPLLQERDYPDFPVMIFKDIIFMDETTSKEIGWYNRRANLIWTSDIFHFLDHTKTTFPLMINSIIDYRRYGRLQDVLTIGADPEFEIVDEQHNLIAANSLLGDRTTSSDCEIGCDGNAATGEFRPKPSNSPLGLTRNIKRLIRRLNGFQTMATNKVWVGGGHQVTTGGHIHFGMQGIPSDLQNLLYDMVAAPVMVFQSEKRAKLEAGRWQRDGSDAVRSQPHGVEWRALPSFIVSEEVTAAVLSTTYAIIKSWKFHEYRGPIVTNKPIIATVYHKIPLYSVYKNQIDTFVKYFVTKEEKISLQRKDLFAEWRINRVHRECTAEIISQAAWLGDYFTPVNVNLKKPVKIEIRFGGDSMSTFGIKTSQLKALSQFAHDHYLPLIEVNETLPKGQSRPLINLPSAWYYMTGKTLFCESFKAVLKDLILTLGGRR